MKKKSLILLVSISTALIGGTALVAQFNTPQNLASFFVSTSGVIPKYTTPQGGVPIVTGSLLTDSGTALTYTGTAGVSSPAYATATNCSSAASPAVCGSAAAGAATIAASATTVVVNTTAVTASSEIFIGVDESLGTRLSVTCNTTAAQNGPYQITARTAGTSFTITTSGTTPSTNPACLVYRIEN